jgi:hypothetical protein
MKYILEYNPQISETCKTYIANNINPVFSNEDTDIYGLDYVIEVLEEEINQNDNKDIFGIELKDIETLRKLNDENVSYIEF